MRAIVYRGAGTQAFASGADISEFKENRKDTETALRYNAPRRPPTPRSASAQADGRHGLRLLHGRRHGRSPWRCDFRFAAEGSKFGIPAAQLSIIYGLDPVHQLVDLVGPAYAKDILYSARTVERPEALRIGFIQRLVPAAELEAYTYDYLNRSRPTRPCRSAAPRLTSRRYFEGINDAHRERLETLAHRETFDSEDYREGTRAFLEKRAPRFQGR